MACITSEWHNCRSSSAKFCGRLWLENLFVFNHGLQGTLSSSSSTKDRVQPESLETNPLWKWVGALCRAGNRLPTQAWCSQPRQGLRERNSRAFRDEHNEMNFRFSFVLLSKEMNNYAWCSNSTGLSSFYSHFEWTYEIEGNTDNENRRNFPLLDVMLYGLLPCRRRRDQEEVSNERPFPSLVEDYPSLVFRFIFNWISLFICHQISFTFSQLPEVTIPLMSFAAKLSHYFVPSFPAFISVFHLSSFDSNHAVQSFRVGELKRSWFKRRMKQSCLEKRMKRHCFERRMKKFFPAEAGKLNSFSR